MKDKSERIELIQLVITRIKLSPAQVALFKELYHANGRWLSKSELAHRIREDDEKGIVGVLGALGNRINQTEGVKPPYDGIGLMMEWATFHDEFHYRILPEFCTVIEKYPILRKAIELSAEEIYTRYEDGLAIA